MEEIYEAGTGTGALQRNGMDATEESTPDAAKHRKKRKRASRNMEAQLSAVVAGAQKKVDTAEAKADAAKKRLDAELANLDRAQEDLEKAKEDLRIYQTQLFTKMMEQMYKEKMGEDIPFSEDLAVDMVENYFK
jgi:hypothetical protein